MKKIIPIIVIVFSFVIEPYAQEIHKRISIPETEILSSYQPITKTNNPASALYQSIGLTTNYDYCANGIYRNSILYNQTPIIFSMVRPFPPYPSGQRHIVKSVKDSTNNFVHTSVFESAAGFPEVDLSRTGTAQNLIGIIDQVNNRLALQNLSESVVVKPVPGSSPAFVFSNGNILLATLENNDLKIYKSTDLGDTFQLIDSLSRFHPSPIYGVGVVDFEIFKSPNEQHIVILGTNEGILGGGAHVYNGYPENQADNVWIIYSTDFGASWSGKTIAVDGKPNLVSGYHTPNFAPLFENFSQLSGTVTNNGIIHVAANGYGVVLDSPTGNTVTGYSFPLLYWNSQNETWKSISAQSIDNIQEIGDYYPPNSIGQAYPSIAVTETGQHVFVLWTGPQLTSNGQLDLADNGTGNTYYWRDLYKAYSYDGGNDVWHYGDLLANHNTNLSDVYGQVDKIFETIDSPLHWIAHFKFLIDQTTGVGVFDGVLTNNDIVYGNYTLIATSNDYNSGILSEFKLFQNYPNPFNPVTKIRFVIPNEVRNLKDFSSHTPRNDNTLVRLKVYDILGNEVATLINEEKPAGEYEIEFNAAKYNITSGIYFYKLTAGSFTETRKMILMK
ncbi:MAG: T9SS type A sorting domain-containing protein [Ignavibacterium sp.]